MSSPPRIPGPFPRVLQEPFSSLTGALLKSLTGACVHGLDLLARVQIPEADVGVEGAGGGDGPVVADVHRDHAQLVALQVPLELQLLV